jgi:hypothetical protein
MDHLDGLPEIEAFYRDFHDVGDEEGVWITRWRVNEQTGLFTGLVLVHKAARLWAWRYCRLFLSDSTHRTLTMMWKCKQGKLVVY